MSAGHDSERLPAGVCAGIALAGSVAAWLALLGIGYGVWWAVQAVALADVVSAVESVGRAAWRM